jgi:single-stranded-DNA-specific exonuclease
VSPDPRAIRRWIPPAALDAAEVRGLSDALRVPPAFAEILLRRGLSDAGSVRAFLAPRLDGLHDPFLLPDMTAATERIERALARDEGILVHGDYDADGMSAAALLTLALRRLGARVETFVPHRTRDGYDLSEAGLQRAARMGASLIVTADCGISAVGAVARAGRQGRDVIVTDHHRPGPRLPSAEAVIDPMRSDSAYPFRGLSGVGVAFKLVQALFGRAGIDPAEANQHLDLVAIGTVADQMPLTEENRTLVRSGLLALERTRKPGLRALLRRIGVEDGERATADLISFRLGPRLNSVGRMASAEAGLRLLLTGDPHEGERLAAYLDQQNAQRRDADRQVWAEVERMVSERYDPARDRAVVLWGDGWHPGVIGIVASRVAETTFRPAVVVAFDGDVGRGSGRSVEGFHLFRALQELSPLLERFGGHRMAAGFSIRRDRVEEFAERLHGLAAKDLPAGAAAEELRAELVIRLDLLDAGLREWLARLEPFGADNPAPVLVARGVRLERIRPLGPRGEHLRLELVDDGTRLPGIAFRLGDREAELRAPGPRDVALHLEENRWNGRRQLQARVLDVRAAER